MRIIVTFICIIFFPTFACSQIDIQDSIIDICKKEYLYELYNKCGDCQISFKETGKRDSSKIHLTEDILKENLSILNYGNICYHIKDKHESLRHSINVCFFVLDRDYDSGFMTTQGEIKSVAPLYYKLLRKSNLIICLYLSIPPDSILDHVGFVNEFFLNKIIDRIKIVQFLSVGDLQSPHIHAIKTELGVVTPVL